MNISFTLEDDKVKGVNITINLEDKFIKSLLYCSGQKMAIVIFRLERGI